MAPAQRQGEFEIPPRFADTVRTTFAPAGEAWLAELPARLEAAAARWQLTLGAPFPDLTYHYVLAALQADGTPRVLKAGVPRPELTAEIAALRLYDGCGAVRLRAADAEAGLLLLERLAPGTPLSRLEDDDQATAIAAEVMRQLWRPPPAEHAFPTVEDWAGGLSRLRTHYGGTTGPFPPRLVARAESLCVDLLASSATPPGVLHGDLHHDNILAAGERGWLAIDPKGVVGEPAYEVGALLRNPGSRLAAELAAGRPLASLLDRRVGVLAERLDLDRRRVVGWGMAQAVLSAWWSVEDGEAEGPPALMLAVAEALAEL